MKHHVSWVFALVVGFVLGYVANGATVAPRTPSRAAPTAAAQRARPPAEDPRAVYRVPVDDVPTKGPADALVTIVESSDFECPYCKLAVPTLKQIAETYRGKVRFAFRHNPLPMHPRAVPAAIAAEEARAQGGDAKFWAMHDALFGAPALDEAALLQAAKSAQVDPAKVKEALASGSHKDRIERDQRLVRSIGASATPTFFVNGRKLAGAQPFPAFQAIIEDELKKAEALVQGGTPPAQVYARIMERAASAPVLLPSGAEQPSAQAAPSAPSAPSALPPAPAAVFRDVALRADDPARGPADAKLTIALFSDFQCPYCGKIEPSLAELERAFPGQVRIVWKHQPLPMHAQAVPAALAAEAAREQGKFWPMHAKLFSDQQGLGPPLFSRYAKELGLDVRRFEQAVSGRRGEARIEGDRKLASELGVNGTPTMFFNCRQVVGAQPLEQLRAIAEEEVRKADQLLAGQRPGPGFYARACKANLASAAAAPPPPVQPVAAQAGPIDVRPDDPVRGNPRAPVTLVVFSDFQCPYCARMPPTLDEVQRAYGDKVRIVWKHQPLPFHPNALPAAEAAEAAREQGKFWQMHDRLFASQRELSPDAYERFAREIGLDVRRFQESVRSGKARARIDQDQRLASRVGADGTPTLFVNGEKVVGAVPFATLKPIIDRKLAK